MTRNEFKKHIEKTLKELKLYAELHAEHEFPDDVEFTWDYRKKPIVVGKNEVIEYIADKVYLGPEEIFPCVDLVVTRITENNRTLIWGRIAGFGPRKYGRGWSNRPGPFIYGIFGELISDRIDHKSKEFQELLFEKGLLHNQTE